ncbi:hypothetical protein DUZ44_005166 [Escherichia coli]|nr:hypothetical protein [Escherichia coli]EEY0595667.1 hypothetical protein [Escherichia coli]
MTSLKTSIKTITYLSDTGCLEIQGASLLLTSAIASNSFSSGMQVLRAQMAASGGGEITVGGQTVRITYSETDGRFLASGGNNIEHANMMIE